MTHGIAAALTPAFGGVALVPPHNYAAEQAVLGAVMLNNKVFERFSDFLRPEHFADPFHGRLYAACTQLINRGALADPVTLTQRFAGDQELADLGGARYMSALVNSVVSVVDAPDYARLVHDLHIRRELIDLAQGLIENAAGGGQGSGMDMLVQTEARLFDLSAMGSAEGGPRPLDDVLGRSLARIERVAKADGQLIGLSTGFPELDKLLGGLQAPDLLILGARPSMGKTALAVNMAVNAAQAGAVVALFSLEMGDTQVGDRVLADEAGVAVHRVRSGPLSDDEFKRLCQARFDLAALGLEIDDQAALTVSHVRARARRLKRKRGRLDLIVVDYLQLMRGDGENRVNEISAITRGLKAVAKDLAVPIVVLSQLSRAVEQREDKRPQMADLRESGAIEQDADTVMFLYREQYYLERAEPSRRGDESDDKFNERYNRWQDRCRAVWGTAEVIVPKNRQGPVGSVRLSFEAAFTRFGHLDSGGGGDEY